MPAGPALHVRPAADRLHPARLVPNRDAWLPGVRTLQIPHRYANTHDDPYGRADGGTIGNVAARTDRGVPRRL